MPIRRQPASPSHRHFAEERVRALFEAEGWRVREGHGDDGAHLIVRKRGVQYAVETKSAPEGRADRLVPLVAQAVLQAAQLACRSSAPLAVVAAPRIPRRVADQVLAFAERYAPGAAVGVIDFEGLALFRGPRLENLNVDAVRPVAIHSVRQSGQLFSDLNQWMLKVLLAPELPESLLAAPRGRYRNASQLARAADVSVMSAFRFVQQLEREGFLHESASHLSLVRRQELFGRWQALASRSSQDVPMRFVLPGDNSGKLRGMLAGGRACLALFAAADALGLGFVSGVPPYVYLQRLRPGNLAAWRNLRPCAPGEPPDLILRRAPAPEAVFRGLVRPEGMAACDVLQVWLDVGSHPSRGQEQADMIRRRVLHRLIEEGR